MGSVAAIGIHDDLAAGQSRVPRRAADNKAARGIDEILGLLVEQLRGDHRADHMLQHILENLRLGHLGAVLGGEHHGVHSARDGRPHSHTVTWLLPSGRR